jgi:pantetheine-phosphate adenylyltransferase
MKKIAVFPGSFDPFTLGHYDIITRALPLFDELIVAVGENSTKNALFSLEKRMFMISKTFESVSKVKILNYQGLTIDFCKQMNAQFLLRGLRTAADFEFERSIAHSNKTLLPSIETVFMLTAPEYSFITSTIVREILRNKGDVSGFVPHQIHELLKL